MKGNKYLYKVAISTCSYHVVARSMAEAMNIVHKHHPQKEIISIYKESNVPVLINSIKYDND